MSTYILMRILESSPERYDRGIRILSLGKLDKVYDDLISNIKKGQKVLDIGCGTGALSIKAARKEAWVMGIDLNPQMLEIARKKAEALNLSGNLDFREMGVAELESFESQTYDVVVSGLCFSELSEDELAFTLQNAHRILKENGLLLLADETEPSPVLLKMFFLLIRIPLKVITYILTQSGTHAVKYLPEKVKMAGFRISSMKRNRLGSFIQLVAVKSEGMPE